MSDQNDDGSLSKPASSSLERLPKAEDAAKDKEGSKQEAISEQQPVLELPAEERLENIRERRTGIEEKLKGIAEKITPPMRDLESFLQIAHPAEPHEAVLLRAELAGIRAKEAEILSEIGVGSGKENREAQPFTKEEIEQTFTTDNLSKLPLEEYIGLLQRVPARFITHVTRQGVRDKASFHSGRGAVDHGFERIVEQGALQSKLEQALGKEINTDSVAHTLKDYLGIPKDHPDRASAEQRIEDFLERSPIAGETSEIADLGAVHMATEMVADAFYGGESGNEFFFVYPAAYIASQFELAGQSAIPDNFGEHGDTKYNDLWVKEKKDVASEIPLDAGIAFVPADALVDPRTGSRYEIGPDGQAIENTEQIEALKRFASASAEEWPSIQNKIYENANLSGEIRAIEERTGTQDYPAIADQEALSAKKEQLAHLRKDFKPFLDKARESGITDPRFYKIFEEGTDSVVWQAAIGFFNKVTRMTGRELSEFEQEELNETAARMQMGFKLAERTIPSQEYWEQKFAAMSRKPSKVVYYEGGDPNKALAQFKKEHGLDPARYPDLNLTKMFADNITTHGRMHQQLAPARVQFRETAKVVLDGIFGPK